MAKSRMDKMFKIFKTSRQERLNAAQPKNKWVWLSHIASELIGTIWLSFALAGLSTYINNRPAEQYFLLHDVLVAFYAGFIAVGSCLIIFLRWSCDLNPAVTIYRWLNGTNTSLYAIVKIVTQFAGGIIAGLIIYAIGSNVGNHMGAANSAISAIVASNKGEYLGPIKNSIPSGAMWIFFGEMFMTAILLFPIFSPRIQDKYRDLFIMFIISLSVWMGMFLGSAAINPVRGLAQQVPDLFFGIKQGSTSYVNAAKALPAGSSATQIMELAKNDLMAATLSMVFGTLCAPVCYALIQGFTRTYLINWLNTVIGFKNNKAHNMITNRDLDKDNK